MIMALTIDEVRNIFKLSENKMSIDDLQEGKVYELQNANNRLPIKYIGSEVSEDNTSISYFAETLEEGAKADFTLQV